MEDMKQADLRRQTDKAPQGERETQTGRFMEIEKKSSTAAASTSRDGDRAIYADKKVCILYLELREFSAIYAL